MTVDSCASRASVKRVLMFIHALQAPTMTREPRGYGYLTTEIWGERRVMK